MQELEIAYPATAGHGNGNGTICGFHAPDNSLFASFSFSSYTASPYASWAEKNGNTSLTASWAQKKDGYLSLLSGGTLNVKKEGQSSELPNYTIVLDMRVPSQKRLGRDHSSQRGTLVPLFHLGDDPHQRVAAGFTQYEAIGRPLDLSRGLWSFVVGGRWSHVSRVEDVASLWKPGEEGTWMRVVLVKGVMREVNSEAVSWGDEDIGPAPHTELYINGSKVFSISNKKIEQYCAKEVGDDGETFFPKTCMSISSVAGVNVVNQDDNLHTKRHPVAQMVNGLYQHHRPRDRSVEGEQTIADAAHHPYGYSDGNILDCWAGVIECPAASMVEESTPYGRTEPYALGGISIYSQALDTNDIEALHWCGDELSWEPLQEVKNGVFLLPSWRTTEGGMILSVIGFVVASLTFFSICCWCCRGCCVAKRSLRVEELERSFRIRPGVSKSSPEEDKFSEKAFENEVDLYTYMFVDQSLEEKYGEKAAEDYASLLQNAGFFYLCFSSAALLLESLYYVSNGHYSPVGLAALFLTGSIAVAVATAFLAQVERFGPTVFPFVRISLLVVLLFTDVVILVSIQEQMVRAYGSYDAENSLDTVSILSPSLSVVLGVETRDFIFISLLSYLVSLGSFFYIGTTYSLLLTLPMEIYKVIFIFLLFLLTRHLSRLSRYAFWRDHKMAEAHQKRVSLLEKDKKALEEEAEFQRKMHRR